MKTELKKEYKWIDPDGMPDYPNMDVETCQDCGGNSDPLDDCFYCGECGGRGWIYVQQYYSPYLSNHDFVEWRKEAVDCWGDEEQFYNHQSGE